MAGKNKFKDTIITDLGRKMLIFIGAGEGMITYTQAKIYSQDVNGKDDPDIRALTSLDGEQLATTVGVTDIQDNHITVSASFNNKTLTDDVTFNSIGWFAKVDKDDPQHTQIKADTEYLIGITPTNGEQLLAAAPPDHRSSQSINADLNMAISNDAHVDMTVNEAGTVHRSELNFELTKIKDAIDKEIANFYNKIEVDSKLDFKADKSDTYTKKEVDDKIAGIDVSGQVAGKADASNVFNKTEINNMLMLKADKSDTYTKKEIDDRLSPITTKQNDHENRLKFLEQRPYFETKTFAKDQEAEATAWENEGQQGMRLAIVLDK